MSRPKTLTVGELKEKLKDLHDSTPVYIPVYESYITEAGSDLGDDVEHGIVDVHDLQNRVEISVRKY